MALGGLKVRAVLLDGLGTLVALAPPWQALAAGLWHDYRIELSAGEAEWAFAAEIDYYRAHHLEGRDIAALAELRGRCAEVLHAALPPHAAQALSPRQLTAAMLDALRFTIYPDALATLGLLRARGLRLVVVSNWDISLAPTLHTLGLGGMLDAVVTSAGVGTAKPAPEIFHAALRAVGVVPEEAVHVGDDPNLDVVGADAAGIMPVLLHRGLPGQAPAVGANTPRRVFGQEPVSVDMRRRRLPKQEPAGVVTISSLAELPGLI
jgi:putative hydrolase of the HAD superfamily